MKQSSLDIFNSLVDLHYSDLKKYIVKSDEKIVIIEDREFYAYGKNPELSPLFDKSCSLPISNIKLEYREKDWVFIYAVELI